MMLYIYIPCRQTTRIHSACAVTAIVDTHSMTPIFDRNLYVILGLRCECRDYVGDVLPIALRMPSTKMKKFVPKPQRAMRDVTRDLMKVFGRGDRDTVILSCTGESVTHRIESHRLGPTSIVEKYNTRALIIPCKVMSICRRNVDESDLKQLQQLDLHGCADFAMEMFNALSNECVRSAYEYVKSQQANDQSWFTMDMFVEVFPAWMQIALWAMSNAVPIFEYGVENGYNVLRLVGSPDVKVWEIAAITYFGEPNVHESNIARGAAAESIEVETPTASDKNVMAVQTYADVTKVRYPTVDASISNTDDPDNQTEMDAHRHRRYIHKQRREATHNKYHTQHHLSTSSYPLIPPLPRESRCISAHAAGLNRCASPPVGVSQPIEMPMIAHEFVNLGGPIHSDFYRGGVFVPMNHHYPYCALGENQYADDAGSDGDMNDDEYMQMMHHDAYIQSILLEN